MAHIAVWLTGLGLMLVFSLSASIALADDPKSSPTTQPSPHPGLSPKAVVKIVADALAKNDAGDNGILQLSPSGAARSLRAYIKAFG